MILSHDWRFIFLKTEKTGSTAVEMALAGFCGPLDIVTPIHAADESVRLADGIRARNFIALESAFEPEADLEAQEARLKTQGYAMRHHSVFYNHMPAAQIREHVGARIFDSFFKFAVERDPREKLISYYFWLGKQRETSFADFVASFEPTPNWQRYTIDGTLAVDRLIRYDRLDEGLREVLAPLGIAWPGQMKRAKSGFRPPEATIDAMFDADLTRLVEQRFARDFEFYAMAT
ncbi:MAG: hypothetical protein WEC00_06000 [Dongiaceae bacterium]